MRRKLEQHQGLLDEPVEMDESDFLETVTRTISRKGGGLLGELLNPPETGLDEGYLDDQGRLVVTEPSVRERNFRNWFGDSKVVDEEGKPLVVYHGTDADFTAFSSDAERLPWNTDGVAHYFSTEKSVANGYGKTIMPVYLSAKNPKTSENFEHTNVTAADVARLKALGYDSIYFDGRYKNRSGDLVNGPEEWVIFDPTQIKSIHNRGTYNPDDPDLLGMNTMNMSLLYG